MTCAVLYFTSVILAFEGIVLFLYITVSDVVQIGNKLNRQCNI